MLTALAVFAVVLPAELPDKSMFASIVLGTRFPGFPVWCGIAVAFAVHVCIAIAAAGLIALLPQPVVGVTAAALFTAGALVLARQPPVQEEEAEEEREVEALARGRRRTAAGAIATGFLVIFVGEWGDLTQLLTASLAARYGQPLSVFVGAVAALWTVSALAVLLGRTLLRVIPLDVLRRIAVVLLAVLAAVTLVETIA